MYTHFLLCYFRRKGTSRILSETRNEKLSQNPEPLLVLVLYNNLFTKPKKSSTVTVESFFPLHIFVYNTVDTIQHLFLLPSALMPYNLVQKKKKRERVDGDRRKSALINTLMSLVT